MAGVSRSATIVIAYLMWTQHLKYKEALEKVKEKRPLVGPNEGFEKQLEMFEKYLIDNDYDIEKIKFKEIEWKPPKELLDSFY